LRFYVRKSSAVNQCLSIKALRGDVGGVPSYCVLFVVALPTRTDRMQEAVPATTSARRRLPLSDSKVEMPDR
jgi:hypothetical protein